MPAAAAARSTRASLSNRSCSSRVAADAAAGRRRQRGRDRVRQPSRATAAKKNQHALLTCKHRGQRMTVAWGAAACMRAGARQVVCACVRSVAPLLPATNGSRRIAPLGSGVCFSGAGLTSQPPPGTLTAAADAAVCIFVVFLSFSCVLNVLFSQLAQRMSPQRMFCHSVLSRNPQEGMFVPQHNQETLSPHAGMRVSAAYRAQRVKMNAANAVAC